MSTSSSTAAPVPCATLAPSPSGTYTSLWCEECNGALTAGAPPNQMTVQSSPKCLRSPGQIGRPPLQKPAFGVVAKMLKEPRPDWAPPPCGRVPALGRWEAVTARRA